MAWLDDVRSCVQALPTEFRLADLDPFIPSLHRKHPGNEHIRAKIRQQLQMLRDLGELDFLGDGHYRQREQGSDWPLKAGMTTTRHELAEILGMSGQAALQRGMFKISRGRFSRDLLLFHHAEENPYGDKVEEGDRILYVGQGKEGDQKREGFNLALEEHLARGLRVHFFVKETSKGRDVRYEGQVVLDEVERVYREDEGRSVLQFTLVPVGSPQIASNFGAAYRAILEETLEPHVLPRRERVQTVRRLLRDRAFGTLVKEAYRNECAVCGPPLTHEDRFDLQGAHVRSVAAGGPDARNNGMCLCARHHWAFDNGVFSLTDDYRIALRPGYIDPHQELQVDADVRLPQNADLFPHAEYLSWHRLNWSFH